MRRMESISLCWFDELRGSPYRSVLLILSAFLLRFLSSYISTARLNSSSSVVMCANVSFVLVSSTTPTYLLMVQSLQLLYFSGKLCFNRSASVSLSIYMATSYRMLSTVRNIISLRLLPQNITLCAIIVCSLDFLLLSFCELSSCSLIFSFICSIVDSPRVHPMIVRVTISLGLGFDLL